MYFCIREFAPKQISRTPCFCPAHAPECSLCAGAEPLHHCEKRVGPSSIEWIGIGRNPIRSTLNFSFPRIGGTASGQLFREALFICEAVCFALGSEIVPVSCVVIIFSDSAFASVFKIILH